MSGPDGGMMRWWDEMVATLTDVVSMPILMLASIATTALLSLALYFWPAWLPWKWRLQGSGKSGRERDPEGVRHRWRLRWGRLRWRWPRWSWRRRKPSTTIDLDQDLPADQLPDLPSQVLALTADQLAAAGRYREAVRERLRAIVRDLIERGVIPHSPGWTVTELAAAAVTVNPALSPPLRAATDVFSAIWYGERPARQEDDTTMRGCAQAVTAILDQATPATVATLPMAGVGTEAGE